MAVASTVERNGDTQMNVNSSKLRFSGRKANQTKMVNSINTKILLKLLKTI